MSVAMHIPTSIKILPMTEEDIDVVMEIENVSFPRPWLREFFEKELKSPISYCFVEKAVLDGVRTRPSADVYTEVAPGKRLRPENLAFYFHLLQEVKGQNVFPRQEISEVQAPGEVLLQLEPDVILVLDPAATEQKILARPGWRDMLKRTGARLVISPEDPDVFFRPGPRGVEGLERLREYVQPVGKGTPQ